MKKIQSISFVQYARILILSLYIIPIALQADLPDIKQSYGLYNGVKDNFKHLSPFHGFILNEKKTIRNIYAFFPTKDPLAMLIRELFYLDGDTFKATSSPTKIAARLTPAHIGKILATIQGVLNEKGQITIAPEELKKQLVSAVGIEVSKNLPDFMKLIINALKASGHFGSENQLYPLYFAHDILLLLLYKTVKNKDSYKDYFATFNNIPTIDNGSGIVKPNGQELMSKSYEQDNRPETQSVNIIEDFSKQPANNLWNYATAHYESLGYARVAAIYLKASFPRYSPMGSGILLKWFKDRVPANMRGQYGISDCVENAIRNVLNTIYYKEGKFDTSKIPNTIFAEFLKEFGPTAITGGLTHETFADRVANIPGVEYGHRAKIKNGKNIIEKYEDMVIETSKDNNEDKPFKKPEQDDGWYYFELNSSLPNIVLVINHLLGLKLQNFNEFVTTFKLTCKQEEVQEVSADLSIEGPVATTICKMTDVDKKTCELKVQPKHSEVKEFVELDIAQKPMPKQIFLEKFASRASMILPMLNLFGINIGYSYSAAKLSEIPNEYWILTLAMQDLKEPTTVSMLSDLIAETKIPTSQSNWYSEFITRLKK